jgi:predicted peptidase
MEITKHIQENAFGYLVNYKLYQPVQPSKDYLIFMHGQGELGAADGSQLDDVETHGYPKHAKNGYEFPFNIVAVQAEKGYATIRRFLPAYIKLKYSADTIIATGLSLGGYGTFQMKMFDYLNLVYAIAPVAGGELTSNAEKYPEVHGWAFHGDKDTTVRYTASQNFVNEYNKTHAIKMKYTLYPGIGHNSWDKAYSVAEGHDHLLSWIKERFNEARPKVSGSGPDPIKELIEKFILDYSKLR